MNEFTNLFAGHQHVVCVCAYSTGTALKPQRRRFILTVKNLITCQIYQFHSDHMLTQRGREMKAKMRRAIMMKKKKATSMYV